MTTEALRETYRSLSETLAALGLVWIVHQVEERVRDGRPVEKEARVFRDDATGESWLGVGGEMYGARRPGKPTVMMTLEPWSEDCRLLFLIDAIRHAIVHAAAVENEQLRLLRRFDRIEAVRFEPDEESGEGRSLRVQGLETREIQRLGELLDALEREVRA